MIVGYSREDLAIDGEKFIAHRFPCTECDVSVLIWDDDVDQGGTE
jgi:hypothetical protein